MRKIMLLLFGFFLVFNFVSAQGYLQNDGTTTHTDGITINEVSAWSNPVDYNADGGSGSFDEDEFIEIVNSSTSPINISGWQLADETTDSGEWLTFGDITIQPGRGVVVFTRDADISNFNPGDGNFVVAAPGGFQLAVFGLQFIGLRNNDDVYISVNWVGGGENATFTSGATDAGSIAMASWTSGQSQSRNPDYTGTMGQHPTISGIVDWSIDGLETLTNPQGSPGRRVGQDIPLPVELISFKAIAGNGTVNLRWETSSESENQGFILQRSDGKIADFNEIASYENESELRGAGSTSEKTSYQYIDKHLFNGIRYYYKLIDVSMNGVQTEQGTVSAIPHSESMNVMVNYPKSFDLNQNYPNPFNPSTKIRFSIPKTDQDILDINVAVYNQLGQKVKSLYNGPISPGEYELEWNGLDENNQSIPTGIYLYHLHSSQFSSSKKMIFIK